MLPSSILNLYIFELVQQVSPIPHMWLATFGPSQYLRRLLHILDRLCPANGIVEETPDLDL